MTRMSVGPSVITTGDCRVVTGDGPVMLRVEAGRLVAPFGGDVYPADLSTLSERLTSVEADAKPISVRWLMPTGEVRHFEVAIGPARVDERSVYAWDVTAHVRHQQELEHKSLHDPLTGLANRVLFEERVSDELRRRARTGRSVAVLYADLDGFKQVNDTRGHAAGDLVLTTLADRLRTAVRPGDVVARLGGDEFAICCPDLSDTDAALLVAQRVIDDVTTPVHIGSSLMRVSVAVGVALADADEQIEPERLIARADLAMYAAKSTGRPRVSVAPPSSHVQGRETAEPAAGVA